MPAAVIFHATRVKRTRLNGFNFQKRSKNRLALAMLKGELEI